MTEIDQLQFSIMSAETIRKLSVAEINTHDVFEKGIPKHGGLSDLRLGTIDRQFKCQTCKHDALGCIGHFGHIELGAPVYHICYLKYIHKTLQCICVDCGKCKSDIGIKFAKRSKQQKYVHDSCKTKMKCIYCDTIQPKIILEKYELFFEYEQKEKISTAKILEIFSKIDDNTIKILGFHPTYSHPKNMIFTVLPVPPPHVRPSISMDSSLRSQDDLTHKLSEIVKTNNLLLKQITAENAKEQIEPLIDLLQYHITTYIDNGIPGINQATQRTGRPLKAICQRLKSKEGRVRGNLMGKRVNFSARTVITAEPNIDLDELGVPFEICKTLTFPEKVASYNINTLQSYVDNGPNPEIGVVGANIVHQGRSQKDLRFVKNIELNIGDVVDRHLKDGDIVVFNRQPSLHKMSMMGHKIKVMPHSTFRMNVCATTPYNADYDGDEMNIHAPQSLVVKSEIQELMMVSRNMVSPQSNKPVIGIIQDTLLGCHKITLLDTFIPKCIVQDICMKLKQIPPFPAILKPKPLWTGKQIISMLLPEDFHFERKSNLYTEKSTKTNDDSYVLIKNGKILSGNLDKRSLGSSEGGIIHLLWLEYGHTEAKDFVSRIQYAVNYWLVNNGFSIGAMDIFIDKNSEKKVELCIEDAKQKVNQMINVSKNSNVSYENKINQLLNNAMSNAGLIVKNNITLKNNINSTVTGGSKGSMFNISQIMGCVGQQNVNGQRIDLGYTHRVLPHFEKHEISPEAKGFVENSYKKGLTPYEFYFHAMGGREGIIDTAVKTSETGYIQRRLIKAMEDIQVNVDHSVRNSSGDIVSFLYGDDGLDASLLISDKIDLANISKYLHPSITKLEETKLLTYQKMFSHSSFTIRTPFLIDRLLVTYPKCSDETLTPIESFNIIDNLCEKIRLTLDWEDINFYATYAIKALIYTKLCSKITINNCCKQSLLKICEEIKNKYKNSIAQKGESIGTVAAQSLGENVTQLTLNTFHSAGYSAKNVTLGVPRFRELINIAKVLKSPSMTLYLKDENVNKDHIASSLEYIQLYDVLKYHETIEIEIEMYEKFMEIPDFNENNEFEYNCEGLRLHIDTIKLKTHYINLIDISISLMKLYNNITCIPINNVTIDILFNYNENLNIHKFMAKLKGDVLSGIDGISKVYIDDSVLETDGSSLQSALVHDAFDANKCVTNDIIEVFELLGIEAARKMLYTEIKKVLEFDGTYINDRHFITLADIMTSKGHLMAITRHGINRGDNGPLMKCSFEETIDVLTDSAVFAEKDMLRGVTENITVGKLANVGTGSFDLHYDHCNEDTYHYRPLSACSYSQYEQSFISDSDSEFEESEI